MLKRLEKSTMVCCHSAFPSTESACSFQSPWASAHLTTAPHASGLRTPSRRAAISPWDRQTGAGESMSTHSSPNSEPSPTGANLTEHSLFLQPAPCRSPRAAREACGGPSSPSAFTLLLFVTPFCLPIPPRRAKQKPRRQFPRSARSGVSSSSCRSFDLHSRAYTVSSLGFSGRSAAGGEQVWG